jgi:hypothetical protein
MTHRASPGVVRLPPIVDPKTKKAAPNPADPIYFDTAVSRRRRGMGPPDVRVANARATWPIRPSSAIQDRSL